MALRIHSFLPNPAGKDGDGEWIKIQNDGAAPVPLRGFWIQDVSGKQYALSGDLPAGAERIVPYSETKISLNNSGETLYLYDASGKLADELSYTGSALEDAVVGHDGVGGGAASELLEDWPAIQGTIQAEINMPHLFLTIALIGAFFAAIFIYAYKKLYGD